MKLLLGIIVGLSIAIAGYAVASSTQPDIEGAGEGNKIWMGYMGGNGTDIKRFVDNDYGLVCWVSSTYRGNGISCVRIDDK